MRKRPKQSELIRPWGWISSFWVYPATIKDDTELIRPCGWIRSLWAYPANNWAYPAISELIRPPSELIRPWKSRKLWFGISKNQETTKNRSELIRPWGWIRSLRAYPAINWAYPAIGGLIGPPSELIRPFWPGCIRSLFRKRTWLDTLELIRPKWAYPATPAEK